MRSRLVYTMLDRCAGWLLPPRCVLCRGAGQSPAYDLCRDCESEIALVSNPCARCGMPLAAAVQESGDDCSRCSALDLPYTRCMAPWAYEFPVTRMVQMLKYEGALANARIFGTRLAAHARPCMAELQAAHALIVPMPLHPTRLVERGFNQSHEIARVTARLSGLVLQESALRRVRATAPQVGLARRQRASNLQGAFSADARIVTGRRVVLIDDVMTTGSTAIEATRTLLAAGAQSVQVWAAARALD